jgi:exosortase A
MSNVEVSSGELSQQASTVTSNARSSRLRALGAMALILLTFALFWPTTASLNIRWQDSVLRTYTHGYLIIAIALWLLWRGRERWSQAPARVSIVGLVMLAALSVAWLIAFRAGVQVLHQALLPLIMATAVLTCFGAAVTWRMGLPLAYLYFAIPIWDAAIPILQWISVLAVQVQLRLVGIPAFFESNTFQIPAGAFEIADGCSGLHFFVVALAISVLYGELNRDTPWTRIKLVVFAALMAMFANWVRIFIIAVAGHLTDMQHYLVSGEHYSFGWGVFAVMMVIYFLVVQRWPVVSKANEVKPLARSEPAIPIIGAGCALAGLLLAPLWNVIDGNQAAPIATLQAANHVAGWERVAELESSWQPEFKGADVEDHGEFTAGGQHVERYTALYAMQRQGKEVVSFENSLLGPTLRATASSLPAVPGPWLQTEVRDRRGAHWLLWHSYQVGEHRQTRALRVQIDYGVRSLFDDPSASIVAVRSPCDVDCVGAQAALTRFVAAISH